MSHVTAESWKRLREGSLDDAERAALVRHLSEACDECDEQVSILDDPALDCAVDSSLASLASEPVSASLVFHRVERRILGQVFPTPRRRWLVTLPIALAAAVALFFVNPLPSTQTGQRPKGEVLRPPALSAVASEKKGATLEPVESTHTYPTTAELFFTYDLPQDAHVYLGRVGVDGVVEPFYPPLGERDAVEPAGLHALTVGGTVHAYSLEGLRGRQRFVIISSPTTLEGVALQQAFKDAADRSANLEVEVAQ